MNKAISSLVILISIAMLTACATMQPPSSEILASADYGPQPENFQELAKQAIGAHLLDPYSAMYENWRGPGKGWAGGGGELYFRVDGMF